MAKRKGAKSWVRSAYAHLAARDRAIKSKDSSVESFRRALYHEDCLGTLTAQKRPLRQDEKRHYFEIANHNARVCVKHGYKIDDESNYWQPYRDVIKRKSRK